MTRYAILAGSNFVGTSNELRGCINDLIDIRSIIEPTGITILADLRDKDMTTSNWKEVMTEAVKKALPGDVIYHCHSHHGSQIRGEGSYSGLSEIWCPDDFAFGTDRMITDKWMASLLSNMLPGVKWIDHCDACHAGDSLRALWCENERPRYIINPFANPKDFLGFLHPMLISGEDRKGILLAACRSDQTSSDAFIGGRSCGAFTNSFIRALQKTPYGTYEDLMIRSTQILSLGGYNQRPEIDCIAGAEHGIFANDVLGLAYQTR